MTSPMIPPHSPEASLAHTPGPWVLDGHNLSSVIHCTAERGSPEAKHLCGDYETIARCEGDNWAANARLIVAAPALRSVVIECQKALAMLTAPDAIKQTSVVHAYAQAVAAETAARVVLARIEPALISPSSQREG